MSDDKGKSMAELMASWLHEASVLIAVFGLIVREQGALPLWWLGALSVVAFALSAWIEYRRRPPS